MDEQPCSIGSMVGLGGCGRGTPGSHLGGPCCQQPQGRRQQSALLVFVDGEAQQDESSERDPKTARGDLLEHLDYKFYFWEEFF